MRRGALLLWLVTGCPSAPEPIIEPEPTPAPIPDPCAEVAAGASVQCPARSCAELVDTEPQPSGDYWVDGGTATSALASCDQGWLRVALADPDGILVAESSAGNPWHKCDDDAAAPYQHITSEDEVVPDWSSGNVVWTVDLEYTHPESGEVYSSAELDALRAPLTELDPLTRMVATTGDDDSGDWQNGTNGGHEVYLVRSDGDWTLLTPGTNGECGGATGWPTPGSRTATYLWATEDGDSELRGDVGLLGRPAALDAGDLLPARAVLVVASGGGVSVGFEQRVARMR